MTHVDEGDWSSPGPRLPGAATSDQLDDIGSDHAPTLRGRLDLPSLLVTTAGVVLLLAVVVVDRRWGGRSLFDETPTRLVATEFARTAVLAVASAALLRGLRALARGSWQWWGESGPPVAWSSLDPRGTQVRGPVLWTAVALPAGAAGLIVAAPRLFHDVVREDGAVEWLSALLLLLAGVATGALARDHLRAGSDRRWVFLFAMGGGGLIFLALEEVSWFQRVFDLETQGRFLENGQKEINLHNFATHAAGLSYLLVGFVVTVAIPIVLAGRDGRSDFAPLHDLVPRPAVVFVAAGAGAYNYLLWSIPLLQVVFFFSVLGLWQLRRWNGVPQTVVLLAAMCALQVALLAFGDRMVRSWDETELRELYIPIGLLLAATQARVVLRRGRSLTLR